jgi:multidrug efflux pump subunit AcrB
MRFVLLALVALGACRCRDAPSVPREHVAITVEHAGASAAEIERSIVLPIEREVARVPGVVGIWSAASEGRATIVVTGDHDLSAPVMDALRGMTRYLPEEVMPPMVVRGDPRAPYAVVYGLAGAPDAVLSEIARDLVEPRVARTPGVHGVEVRGASELAFVLRPDPGKLVAYDVTLAELASALAERSDTPRGLVRATSEREVRARATGDALGELEQLMIATRGDLVVRLRDVAVVELAPARAEPGPVSIAIRFAPRARHEETLAAVETAIGELGASLPAGVTLTRQPMAPAPLEIIVAGPDRSVAAGHVARLASGLGIPAPRPNLIQKLAIDRAAAAALGLHVREVARALQLGAGAPAARWGDRDVIIRLEATAQRELFIRTPAGAVPLERLVQRTETMAPRELVRIDQQPAVVLELPPDLRELASALVDALARELPAGYRVPASLENGLE